MIIYRPHRGSYKESIDSAIEFNAVDEMKLYIAKQFGLSIADVNLSSEPTKDNRNNWLDTRYVKIFYDRVESIIGMCATDYPKYAHRTIKCQ